MFLVAHGHIFFTCDHFQGTIVDVVYSSLDEGISTYLDPCP